MQSNAARLGVLAAVVAAVVVLFIVLSGGDSSNDGGGSTTNAGGGAPAPTVIRVKDGAPEGGIAGINVTKGDTVSLKVFPEAGDEEVHVHGYEIEKPVKGTKPVSLSFPADIEGGFEIEVHTAGGGAFQIADLTVQPG